MAAEKKESDRVAVKTYVPAYQRDQWDEQADELGMSRSEFIRSMVQAGRKDFNPRGLPEETRKDGNPSRTADTERLEEIIRAKLKDGSRSWDELFAELTDDLESELETQLQSLQEDNEVQYSGPQDGYILLE